jgi:hypothetical protein
MKTAIRVSIWNQYLAAAAWMQPNMLMRYRSADLSAGVPFYFLANRE